RMVTLVPRSRSRRVVCEPMNPAPPVTRTCALIAAGILPAASRRRSRRFALGRWRRHRRRLLMLLAIALLDAALLPVADEPAQHLRLVDPNHDVVERVVHLGVVDQLSDRAVAGVDLLRDEVELVDQPLDLARQLLAVRLVVEKLREQTLALA